MKPMIKEGADSGDPPVLGHCHSREVQAIHRPPQQSAPLLWLNARGELQVTENKRLLQEPPNKNVFF